MSTFEAVMVVEGATCPEDDVQYFEALQLLIDTGLAWTLRGFFGRAAQRAITAGECHA